MYKENEISDLFALMHTGYLHNINAVIFDCFGTLVEIKERTDPYKYLLNEIKNLDIPEKGMEFLKDYKKWVMSRKFTWLELECELGINIDIEVKEVFKRLLNKEVDSIEYFSDTLSVIKWLIKNKFKVMICSNLAYQYAEQINLLFKMSGLDKVHLIFSSDVGFIKPEFEIYNKCEDILQEEKENIIFIGDSYKNDYLEPLNYGYRSIWLKRS